MRLYIGFACLAVVFAFTAVAQAVVVEVPVTPDYLKENSGSFSIEAERREDGLIHFTITRRLPRPTYVVTRLTAREEAALVTQKLIDTSSASVVREDSVTHHVALSPKLLAEARFEFAERSFAETGGDPIPLPGGTDYLIRLADFAPKERTVINAPGR